MSSDRHYNTYVTLTQTYNHWGEGAYRWIYLTILRSDEKPMETQAAIAVISNSATPLTSLYVTAYSHWSAVQGRLPCEYLSTKMKLVIPNIRLILLVPNINFDNGQTVYHLSNYTNLVNLAIWIESHFSLNSFIFFYFISQYNYSIYI